MKKRLLITLAFCLLLVTAGCVSESVIPVPVIPVTPVPSCECILPSPCECVPTKHAVVYTEVPINTGNYTEYLTITPDSIKGIPGVLYLNVIVITAAVFSNPLVTTPVPIDLLGNGPGQPDTTIIHKITGSILILTIDNL